VNVLGIDIGGSGVKGAPVDVASGEMLTERYRIETPQPATPDAVAEVVRKIAEKHNWTGPIGCAYPGVVQEGMIHSAANVDASWIGTDGQALFEETTGCPVTLINDADAAGIAEMVHGAGVGRTGVVMLLTFGTGIGSALFSQGRLVPNTELGHLEFRGMEAEDYAAGRVHEDRGLSYEEWGERVGELLRHLHVLFSPELFIFGGGISKYFADYGHVLDAPCQVVPARFRNQAGIIGAAMAGMPTGAET